MHHIFVLAATASAVVAVCAFWAGFLSVAHDDRQGVSDCGCALQTAVICTVVFGILALIIK